MDRYLQRLRSHKCGKGETYGRNEEREARDVVVFSISIGVSLVFLVIAIALRHRNNRRLLIWTSAVEMATLMTMTDTRRVLHGASPTDDFFHPES